MNKFARTLHKAHINVAGWPEWQRIAASSGRVFAQELTNEPCKAKGCPCRKVAKIMEAARAECDKLTETYLGS